MNLPRLDKFKLITYQNIDIDERNVVTLLYQPLIGCKAFSLYLTLWSLIDRSRLKTPIYIHKKLYDILNTTPKAFSDARKKLEAIGLLVVYQNEEMFLYELKAPLTAEEFIKDGNLGAYLFKEIGQNNFDELVSLFKISNTEKDGFKNITTNFDEVFDSLPSPIETSDNYMSRSKSKISLNHDFDFEFFFEGLSKNFVDRRKITSKVKDKIERLSYIYGLDEITMQKAFMDSVNRERSVDLDKLDLAARTWYQFERKTVKPTTVKKEEITGVNTNKEIIELCKNLKPVELLEALFGVKPAAAELKIIDRLLDSELLSETLINFLFVYVIGYTDGQIPNYNFFEKIATDWARNRITSIDEAIKYNKNRNEKIASKKSKGKNLLPKDIESDWLDDYIKSTR